jgi:hypothetical protein
MPEDLKSKDDRGWSNHPLVTAVGVVGGIICALAALVQLGIMRPVERPPTAGGVRTDIVPSPPSNANTLSGSNGSSPSRKDQSERRNGWAQAYVKKLLGALPEKRSTAAQVQSNNDHSANEKAHAPSTGGGAVLPKPDEKAVPISLAGKWMVTGYSCPDQSAPQEEKVEILQRGNRATAIKIIGDNCVPAGRITWRGTVKADAFPVEVHGGFPGQPPSYQPGSVRLSGANLFELEMGGSSMVFHRIE